MKNFKNTGLIIAVILIVILGAGTASWAFIFNHNESQDFAEKNGDEQKQEDEQDELDEEEKRRLEEQKRQEREKELKEELGEFFVPLPPLEQEDNPPVEARGLYLTGHTAGSESRLNEFLDLVEKTELNTLVIDVKDDRGMVTYPSDIEFVNRTGTNRSAPIGDLSELVEKLHERDIYTIARVVVFKDDRVVDEHPEWGLQRKDGVGVWRDNQNIAWVDPYRKEIWDYNVAVAKEAALKGFREIQFDYVRYPDNAPRVDKEVDYAGDKPKEEVIAEFIKYAKFRLDEYNVYLSADTFGVIATSWGDSDNIGQNWEMIAPLVDYHSPMVYPSHYGPGYFGYSVPDANPRGTIKQALKDALRRNAPLEDPGKLRPWLQAFTASWVRGNIFYGPEEIKEQIEAAYRLGIDEYLLWSSGNNYPEDAFIGEEANERLMEKYRQEREEKGLDYKWNNIEDAADEFLEGVERNRWRDAYFYHSTGFTKDHEDYREWAETWSNSLESYEIVGSEQSGERGEVTVSFAWKDTEEEIEEKWDVVKENHVWRVVPSEGFLETLTEEIEEDDNGR